MALNQSFDQTRELNYMTALYHAAKWQESFGSDPISSKTAAILHLQKARAR